LWEKILKKIISYFLQTIKILLPHIGLTALLLSYIAGGAVVFQWLESEVEMTKRREKLKNVTSLYNQIVSNSVRVCMSNNRTIAQVGSSFPSLAPPLNMEKPSHMLQMNATLLPLLENLSWAHEYDDKFVKADQMWTLTIAEQIQDRWTFPAAVCYALTVITTTGEHK
jgi:hypothetical protein